MDIEIKKEEIYIETIKLIKNKNVRFTFDDLANGLHIAKKTIYTIFDSKNALAEWVYKKAFSDYKTALKNQGKKDITINDETLNLFETYSVLLVLCDKDLFKMYSLDGEFCIDVLSQFKKSEKKFGVYLASTKLSKYVKTEAFRISLKVTLKTIFNEFYNKVLLKEYIEFLGDINVK